MGGRLGAGRTLARLEMGPTLLGGRLSGAVLLAGKFMGETESIQSDVLIKKKLVALEIE